MKNSSLHIDQLIQQFLQGTLTETEHDEFLKQMKNSPELEQEVELEKQLQEFLLLQSLAETSELLKNKGQQIKQKQTLKNRSILLASSILLTLGVGAYFIQPKDDPVTPTPKQENTPPIHQVQQINQTPKKALVTQKNTKREVQHHSNKPQDTIIPNQISIDSITEQNLTPLHDTTTLYKDTISSKSVATPTKATQENVVINTCDSIEIEINTLPSCANEATGQIELTNFSSGTAPYQIKCNDEISQDKLITSLPADVYKIIVMDSKMCKTSYLIEIEEQTCEEKIYAFNPQLEDFWEIPLNGNQNGNFVLYNRYGQLIKEQQFSTNDNQWFGTSNDGEAITKGVYIFIITYENGTMIKDELNIMW